MSLSRRQFVARTAAATAALPFASPLAGATPWTTPAPPTGSPRRAEFTAIRNGVGYFTGQGGTIGYLQSPDALVAVDTQFPDSARTFIEGLRERAGDPMRGLDLLVNTHHHGDHTAGNAVLAPLAATHVAHDAVPGLQRAAAVRSGSLDGQRYPSETFERSWSTDLGSEVVSLHYFGPAHTCGDVVTHFERSNVVHMGDLVFNRRQPYIDGGAGASVQGWIGNLATIRGRFDADTVFIFGHAGEGYPVVGDREELVVMAGFLAALYDTVGDALAEGRTPAEIEGMMVPGHDAWGPIPMRVIDPIQAEIERSRG